MSHSFKPQVPSKATEIKASSYSNSVIKLPITSTVLDQGCKDTGLLQEFALKDLGYLS